LGILGGVVAIVLAALLVVPAVVDWTSYRQGLESQLERAIGRKVALDGGISLSLLPAPSFVALDVRLADPDLQVSASRLELRPRLLPLLDGRLEIASLVLHDPDVRLAGAVPATAKAPVAGAATVATGSSGRAGEQGLPLRFVAPRAVASLIIDNGRIDLGGLDGGQRSLERVNASFTSQTGGGARLVGSARLGTADIGFDILQGSTTGPQPTPVSLSVTTAEGGGSLRLSGHVGGDGADRRLQGKLQVKATDPGRVLRDLGLRPAMALPAGALGLEASLTARPHDLALDGVILTLGAMEGQGSANWTFGPAPQGDLRLAFGRIDLDALLAAHPASAPVVPPSTAPLASPASTPSAAAPSFLFPRGVALTLDLGAEVTLFRGALLRGAHLNLALANGEMTVNQASVSLPGDSDINLFGFLERRADGLWFDGSFEAASDDLRGLLDWVRLDVARAPADRLRAARVAGKVKARSDQISLDGVDLRLDGTRIDAAATVRLGDRPALGLSFAADTVNADAYRPRQGGAPTAEPRDGAAAPPPAPMAATAGPPVWWGDWDATLKGHIGQLVVAGGTARDFAVDAVWQDGRLHMTDVSVAEFAGAQVHLSGDAEGLAGGIPTAHDLKVTLKGAQPGRLLRQLAGGRGGDADRLGPMALALTVNGPIDAVQIDGRLDASGAAFLASGRVDGLPALTSLDLGVELSDPSTAHLLRLLLPGYRPSGNPGAFSASARLQGDGTRFHLDTLAVSAGPATLSGSAGWDGSGERAQITADLSAGVLPVDLFWPDGKTPPRDGGLKAPVAPEPHQGLPAYAADKVSAAPRAVVASGAIPDHWSRDPFDFGAWSGWDGSLRLTAKALSFGRTRIEQAGLDVAATAGALELRRLEGRLFGGTLAGTARVAADGAGTLRLSMAKGQMREALMGTADLDIADGVLGADVTLSTTGLSPAEWIGRLRGTATVDVTGGVIRGFDLAAVDNHLKGANSVTGLLALLQSGLNGGATHFDRLSGHGRVDNGLIAIDDLVLDAAGGGAKATAQINLPAYALDGRAEFHLASAPSGPPLVMRLSGPLDHPRRFIDINEIQQWLVGRAKVKVKDVVKGMLKQ
jgi:uncharacterized protein involved in outer membrane biogenesis